MAGTKLTPIMDKDQDNSNLQPNAESSSTEVNTPPQEKDPLVSEQPIEPDKEDRINKDSSVEEKDPREKGWLLFLALLITLGIGFYFYTHKQGDDFFTTLPENLKKLFLTAPKIKNPLDNEFKKTPFEPTQEVAKKIEGASSPDTQPKEMSAKSPEEIEEEEITKEFERSSPSTQRKEMPTKSPGEIVEPTQGPNPFNKTTNENEKTIDLLRDEIQSLKSELKEKSSTLQNFRIKRPHISGGFLAEESEGTAQQEEGESTSETKTLPIISSPAKTEPLTQQNHPQKISPQRSKEVQAYLDFIENTGRKFIELIKEGWARSQALIIDFRGNYLKRY
ncbi:uncharacterized protein METZ01_LOCUS138519 [marine metagenome]|uniref:Uncharacterized protein n=1 Tax=marine metagenome TaxID=408172 RepID=A0A381Z8P3_9ZZZZ